MTDTQNFVLWSFPTRVVLGEGAAAQCANDKCTWISRNSMRPAGHSEMELH